MLEPQKGNIYITEKDAQLSGSGISFEEKVVKDGTFDWEEVYFPDQQTQLGVIFKDVSDAVILAISRPYY